MAVYTHISEEELCHFLKNYWVGELIEWHGIAEGIENSNYYIRTTQGRYILTLFERRVSPQRLPFFMQLMQYFSAHHLPCPEPILQKDQTIIGTIHHKPAVMVSFLEGKGVREIQEHHCYALGILLAKMHHLGAHFPLQVENQLSVNFWKNLWLEVEPKADQIITGCAPLINKALERLEQAWPTTLPKGIIHADAFPDNVFFDESHSLSGIIDFYFACSDFWMYEIAIALNAWCFNQEHVFMASRAKALFEGYETIRTITMQEWQALPLLATGASIRFLMTRLYDWSQNTEGILVTPKDPSEYFAKLAFHTAITHSEEYR